MVVWDFWTINSSTWKDRVSHGMDELTSCWAVSGRVTFWFRCSCCMFCKPMGLISLKDHGPTFEYNCLVYHGIYTFTCFAFNFGLIMISYTEYSWILQIHPRQYQRLGLIILDNTRKITSCSLLFHLILYITSHVSSNFSTPHPNPPPPKKKKQSTYSVFFFASNKKTNETTRQRWWNLWISWRV